MKGVSPCSCIHPRRPSPASDPRFLKQQQDPHLGGHDVKETLELKAEASAPAPQACRGGVPVSAPEPGVESDREPDRAACPGSSLRPQVWGSRDRRPRPLNRTAPSYPLMPGGGEGGLVVAAREVSLSSQSLPCSQGSRQDGALGSKGPDLLVT